MEEDAEKNALPDAEQSKRTRCSSCGKNSVDFCPFCLIPLRDLEPVNQAVSDQALLNETLDA